MRHLITTVVVLASSLLIAAPPKVVEEYSGKVIAITDGDTIKVLVGKESVTVRLEGIDAPEKSQRVRSAYCAGKQGNYRVDCGIRSLTVGKANNALLKVADHVWLKRIDRSVMICCAPS